VAGDPRFFARTGPHQAAAIAAACGAVAARGGDRLLAGIAPLQAATGAELSFLENRRYAAALAASRAGAVIVEPALADRVPQAAALLLSPTPYLAWARACALFHPEPPATAGIHPLAAVDPSARIGAGVAIEAFAVIGANAEIGEGTRIESHAAIGPGCVVGAGCRIGAHASVSHAILGARVFVYPGARIGQPGFGFAPSPQGFVTVPQLGRVLIGDDVEIGANSCVDRGSAGDTVIGAGTRIDNLVQVAHNVRIGRACVIVGQAGISGSTEVGDFVQIGGQAGLTGHLSIGARARIGAQAGVMADVAPGLDVVGSPCAPVREAMAGVALVRRMVAARKGGRNRGPATPEQA
jgi:UDP-3-O-[3-hydroxymyristoyl] glucosamine N-acyltransferase